MDSCTPAFVTAALFISILILDLAKRNYRLLGGHFLLGIISVLLMVYLCQHEAEYVAWGLLLMPFLLLALGFIIGAIQKGSGEPRLTPTEIASGKQEDCTCDENAPYASVCVKHPIDASGCLVKPEEPTKQVSQPAATTTNKTTTTEQICGPTTGIPCVNPAVLQSA